MTREVHPEQEKVNRFYHQLAEPYRIESDIEHPDEEPRTTLAKRFLHDWNPEYQKILENDVNQLVGRLLVVGIDPEQVAYVLWNNRDTITSIMAENLKYQILENEKKTH